MSAILVDKRIDLTKFDIIKYQIVLHCLTNKIRLSDTELNCLSLLGELGKVRLTEFCKIASARGILANSIGVNNCLGKMEARKLHIKEGVGKKMLYLNPELQIQSEGNIIIKLLLVKLETNKAGERVQSHSKEAEFA